MEYIIKRPTWKKIKEHLKEHFGWKEKQFYLNSPTTNTKISMYDSLIYVDDKDKMRLPGISGGDIEIMFDDVAKLMYWVGKESKIKIMAVDIK